MAFFGVQLPNPYQAAASTLPHVPGMDYQICDQTATYLTSPWTYDVHGSGSPVSTAYTVDEYMKLNTDGTENATSPGTAYNNTLPPLPTYMAAESPGTTAAIIYEPGSNTSSPAYDFPNTPILQFFEGGSYGYLGLQTISGDEFIGGSATGFPGPQFNDSGGAGGIASNNDTFSYSGGSSTLAATANAGDTTVTTTSAISAYAAQITFADGTTYGIAGGTPTSIQLNAPLANSETAGSTEWTNSTAPIATVSAGKAQGATTVTLNASSIPLVQWENIVIGTHNYQINPVSGSQSGYTVTIPDGLDENVAAGTPVYYGTAASGAGGVTIEYLDISNDLHATTGTITIGSGWTIEHNKIHDSYRNEGEGVAIYGGDESTIEYNCFSKMGSSGAGGAGTHDVFDYNEVYQSGYEGDPGCGCTGDKWWGSLNADIVDNAFIEVGPSDGTPAVWLDNGNTGTLIEGNYFYHNAGSAIMNETGFNMKVDNNLFLNDGWGDGTGASSNSGGAVNVNSSGGINVPGSRFENQIDISNNYFMNDWEGVTIWQSDQRNCLGSGEGWPVDSAYCSGGFPTTATNSAGGQYYFSHQGDTDHGGASNVAADTSGGSSTVMLGSSEATGDQIGFTNPATATTSDTAKNVSSFNGAGTVNVDSTSGFPSTGQLSAATSNGPAILDYTNTTATSFTGVSLIAQPGHTTSGTLSGSVLVNDPAYATTSDNTDVTSAAFQNGTATVNVSSTAGFPTSGQLRVDTSAAGGGGGFTGAILSYTNSTGTSFTGVTLVRGSGALSGSVLEVQPYKVTGETCYANDCAVSITPALGGPVSADAKVTNAGTCPLYATSVALPSGPLAPNGTSYWDGCQWESRNVSVSSNTFVVQPSVISNSAPLEGGGSTTQCTPAKNCGTNFMAFQSGGSKPFYDQTGGNAMMSSTTFSGCPDWDPGCSTDPLDNINGDPNPPGVPAGNGETPYNNVWSGNTYNGPWMVSDAYSYSGCWPLPTDSGTGNSMPSSDCGTISIPTWQAAWQQDSGSTFNPIAVTLGGITDNQEIYSSNQTVTEYADSGTAGNISAHLKVNGATDTAATLSFSPHTYNLNTLDYANGQYTVSVDGTDTGNNTASQSTTVWIGNGDLNGSNSVDLGDLAVLANHWLQTDPNYNDGNITGQSTINLSDLAVMAANWGWSH